MPNRKEGYADMELFRKTRNEQRKRYYSKTAKYIARPWDEEEDKMVIEHSITDTELSYIIERSVEAIQQRRWRLKKSGFKISKSIN